MTVTAPTPTIRSEEAFLRDEAHAMRAGVHELLARLFAREPDEETLALLCGIGEVDTADGPLALGWELLRVAASGTDPVAARAEYNALFIGVGRGELVPFGSWYLTGFLMEKPLALLRADLARFGIERRGGVAESEDHVAALHEAMALVVRAPDEIPFEEQRVFFAEHMAPWLPRFYDDLQSAASADFYRAVGFFGASFLDVERQLLGTDRPGEGASRRGDAVSRSEAASGSDVAPHGGPPVRHDEAPHGGADPEIAAVDAPRSPTH